MMPVKMNNPQTRKLSRNPSAVLFIPSAVQPELFTTSTMAPNKYPAGAAGTISIVTKAMFRRS